MDYSSAINTIVQYECERRSCISIPIMDDEVPELQPHSGEKWSP